VLIETTTGPASDTAMAGRQETNRYNIGFWTSTEARATWSLRLEPNRRYEVWIVWACAPGHEGGAYVLEVDGQTLEGKVWHDTGHWQTCRRLRLSTFRAGSAPGRTILLRAADPGRQSLDERTTDRSQANLSVPDGIRGDRSQAAISVALAVFFLMMRMVLMYGWRVFPARP